MKILVDSYNTVTQNVYGGVNIKIKKTVKNLSSFADVKLFDKWNDKIEDFDILHIFKTSLESYSIVSLAKKKKVKVIISAVVSPDNGVKFLLNKLAAKIFRQMNSYRINKYVFDMADAIICETKKERDFIINSYSISKRKVYVIPNGVEKVREDASEEYFRSNTGIQGKFILQVGRFDPNKNQLSTIEAVKGTDMQLVLIGGADKDYAGYYQKCKESAGDNVHFLGWIDHNDPLLYSAYKAAHVFVLPSYKEIFGNAMFESGIYGCNIVATKDLPLKTWGFDKHCFAVNPRSVADIKEKLILACAAQKDSNISKIIEEKFSWESVIKRHIEIYKRIMKEDK